MANISPDEQDFDLRKRSARGPGSANAVVLVVRDMGEDSKKEWGRRWRGEQGILCLLETGCRFHLWQLVLDDDVIAALQPSILRCIRANKDQLRRRPVRLRLFLRRLVARRCR